MDATGLAELFEPAGPVAIRRMFGGHGIYAGPVMVGLEADGAVYLRVDALTRATFAEAGCRPFIYEGRQKKPVEMPYWSLPEQAFEDPDALRQWFRLARDAAMRAAVTQRGPRFRRPGDE